MNLPNFFPRLSRRDPFAVARLAGIGAVLVSLTGCVAAVRTRPAHAVVMAPPTTVVVTENPRGPDKVIIIKDTPPPLRREIIVERDRPSPLHVWVAGFWRHDGRAYVWVPGHWDRPPRAHAVWVEPRWERRGGSYVFIEGSWR